MYFEKDAEIEFLQKEISTIMNEKAEKEGIIKSKQYYYSHIIIYL